MRRPPSCSLILIARWIFGLNGHHSPCRSDAVLHPDLTCILIRRSNNVVRDLFVDHRLSGPEELTTAAVSTVLSDTSTPEVPPTSTPDHPSNMSSKRPGRMDNSPSPSVVWLLQSCWTSSPRRRGGDVLRGIGMSRD
jgi:hypothetical protein